MVIDPKAFPVLLSEFLCNPAEISREIISKIDIRDALCPFLRIKLAVYFMFS